MRNQKWLIFSLCLWSWGSMLHAQSGIVASGGSVQNASGSVSYSIGQVNDVYTMDQSGVVSEGIQQPYEIFIITSTESPDHSSEVLVFPNPTFGELRVQINEDAAWNARYSLFHQNGSFISSGELIPGQMIIPMAQYPASIYLLSITWKDEQKTTFKVVKKQ